MCGQYSNRFTWAEVHALYSIFNDPKAPLASWTPTLLN